MQWFLIGVVTGVTISVIVDKESILSMNLMMR